MARYLVRKVSLRSCAKLGSPWAVVGGLVELLLGRLPNAPSYDLAGCSMVPLIILGGIVACGLIFNMVGGISVDLEEFPQAAGEDDPTGPTPSGPRLDPPPFPLKGPPAGYPFDGE